MDYPRQKGIPPYLHVKSYLNEKIEGGEWLPGMQIPAESMLVDQFGLSRMTIRRAIGELINEGKLVPKQGTGTFVSEPHIEANYTNLFFPASLGHTHKVLDCGEAQATHSLAQELMVPPGEPLHLIRRLRLLIDTPAIVEEAYLQKSRFPGLESEDLSDRLQAVLMRRYNTQLTHLDTIIEPVVADRSTADLLQIKSGSPCLKIHRTSYTFNRNPVLYSINIIRGDKCRLKITTN